MATSTLTPVMMQAMRASHLSPHASYDDVQAEAQRLTTAMPTNGGDRTAEQIRQGAARNGFARNGTITDPQGMYDAAQKYGLSSDQIDNAFGLQGGTTNSWIQQQGYNPLATNANGYRGDAWNAAAGGTVANPSAGQNGAASAASYTPQNPVANGVNPQGIAAAMNTSTPGQNGMQAVNSYIPNVASGTSAPQAGVVAQGMPQGAWDASQAAAAAQGVVQPIAGDPWQAGAMNSPAQGMQPMQAPFYGWSAAAMPQAGQNAIQPVSNTYPSGTSSGQLVDTGAGVANMLGSALAGMYKGAGYAR